MTGFTNRPEDVEKQNQERVEERKAELTDGENGNRPQKEHPMQKDGAEGTPGRDRNSETGAGRGADPKAQ